MSDARVLSDEEIERLRGDLYWLVGKDGLWLEDDTLSADDCLRLLATLDAAHTRAVEAERERDDLDNEFQSLAGRVAEYDALLTAALQARERAEQERDQAVACQLSLNGAVTDGARFSQEQRERAERAEAALATERGKGKAVAEAVIADTEQAMVAWAERTGWKDRPTEERSRLLAAFYAGSEIATGRIAALAMTAPSSQAAPHEPSRNPDDYGAKGDGVTDDAPAFQALLDAHRKPPHEPRGEQS